MATLFVLQGRDKGKRFDLRGPAQTMGRESGIPLQISDSEVSRRHAEIRKDEQGYVLVDLGSSNGTFVNAEQIIDVDREPFGTEKRNAAQLENILGTEYQRIGLLGNIFNFGTVYITVGGTKLAFENVLDPAAVQSDINRRFAARKAKNEQERIAKERERMAEWLATYHLNSEALRAEEERKKNQKPE